MWLTGDRNCCTGGGARPRRGSRGAMVYRKTDKVLAHMAARRAAIVDAAVHVLAIGGVDELRVGDVATRAGIAVGAMYRYFPTREDLVAGAIAHVLASDVAAMREAAGAERF